MLSEMTLAAFPTIRTFAPVCAGAVLSIFVFMFAACKSPDSPPSPASPVFNPAKLEEMDVAIAQAISSNRLPGCVLWLERNGTTYHKSYGQKRLVPQPEPAAEDTIFDAASLTKVIATTSSIMLLAERGKIDLESPVAAYIPEFKANGKDGVTVRHLLTHTSGLRPGLSPTPAWSGYDKGIELACAEKLLNAPGTVFRYSDINFILLGELVRRTGGQPLNEFARTQVFEPLQMVDTGFLPSTNKLTRIAPTEVVEGKLLHGVVHDPTSRRMGGVAGHAGLFTTASDLARFARMMLNEGTLDGVRVFKAESVKLMTSVQSPDAVPSRRGIGWDIDSGYGRPRGQHFPLGSYGHTGWTGTSIWIDPFSKTFWIFLSNRVHPDGRGNVLALQSTLGTLAAESVLGFNFAGAIGALQPRPETNAVTPASASRTNASPVLNGIDLLRREQFAPLRGLRVGLITNHTGADRERNPTIDLLHQAPDVKLKALFSPEHGIRGLLDEKVSDGTDEKTGLPIFSLYGETRIPKREHLENLDALVFDIQDIGCRFYTYISTMGNAMEAAAKARIKFFVLDRANPINGLALDGPVLNSETSFVAFHPIPVRHGMTVGELARMFNAERRYGCDLTVIPVEGWKRAMWLDETGLPWTNPSPNMRNLNEATLYPGVGLLEMAKLSVGRGTDTPFEVIGAPYINDVKLAEALNRFGLAGVRFVPIQFTPNASVFKGQRCSGVFIFLTDRERCNVVEIGIAAAQTLHRLYPNDFNLEKFNVLLGHKATMDAIKAGKSIQEIRQVWNIDLEEFKKRRAAYLLYK